MRKVVVEALAKLQNIIKQRDAITFAEFMQFALYDPEFGYYTTKIDKLGRKGDFITAPEISNLFGYSLATQVKQVLSELNSASILEFGAGSGKLCVDVLTKLQQLQAVPDNYYILEVSGELQQRQREYIHQQIPELFSKVIWLQELPQQAQNLVIIANEVLDAMPVTKFVHENDKVYEVFVTLEQQKLIEKLQLSTDKALLNYVETYLGSNPARYESEAHLLSGAWLQQITKIIAQGAIFLIDYGFPAHEYFHPDRSNGTLMCHYQHQAHPNPYLNIGLQDITAHVNFTYIAQTAVDCGLHVAGFTNQASFLINNGILDLLHDVPQDKIISYNQNLKTLLQPNEMGELFKVLAITKQLDIDLNGFCLNDKRVSL